MNRKLMIYGPPASGKSTILRVIPGLNRKRLQYAVFVDLEIVEPTDERRRVLAFLSCANICGPLIIGAADLYPPVDFSFDEWQVVALIPNDLDRYLERVTKRNQAHPEKTGQREVQCFNDFHTHVDRLRNRFALIVDPLNCRNEIELATVILDALDL